MTNARWIGMATFGLALIASGCGGSAGKGGSSSSADGGSTDPGDNAFSIFPDPSFSGFDGTHPYTLPLETDLDGAVTWTVSDSTVASIAPIDPTKVPPDFTGDGGQWAMITIKKAGAITVSGTSGTNVATGKLTIGAYTAAQWTAGQTRWMTAPTGLIACVTCHTGAAAVDNTPNYTSGYSDTDLAGMFTLGQYPDGSSLRAPNHMFTVSDTERDGLVAYLRGLAPKGF